MFTFIVEQSLKIMTFPGSRRQKLCFIQFRVLDVGARDFMD